MLVIHSMPSIFHFNEAWIRHISTFYTVISKLILPSFIFIPLPLLWICQAIVWEVYEQIYCYCCSIWQNSSPQGGGCYRWSGHRTYSQWFTPQPWPTAALEWPTEILTHVHNKMLLTLSTCKEGSQISRMKMQVEIFGCHCRLNFHSQDMS